MVCCCLPCFHKLQERWDPVPGSGPFTLVITEVIRWLFIMLPLLLSTWRYAVLTNHDTDAAFWGIVAGSLLGFSILLYLPVKILALRFRMKRNRLKDYRWRPSIVTYLIICALPCLLLILTGIIQCRNLGEDCTAFGETLDPETITVLQVVVFGLAVTEWMSKLREEHLTYDLITAMSLDFFFAYDCIQFIMLSTYSRDIFASNWLYVCFSFAYVSMFRYVPHQPVGITDKGSSVGAAVNICINMLTVDVPFLIIRVSTMVQFGLIVSDIIHPLKNIGMISFGATQLYIIFTNRKLIQQAKRSHRPKLRAAATFRISKVDAWDMENGDRCIRQSNGQVVCYDDEGNITHQTSVPHDMAEPEANSGEQTMTKISS